MPPFHSGSAHCHIVMESAYTAGAAHFLYIKFLARTNILREYRLIFRGFSKSNIADKRRWLMSPLSPFIFIHTYLTWGPQAVMFINIIYSLTNRDSGEWQAERRPVTLIKRKYFRGPTWRGLPGLAYTESWFGAGERCSASTSWWSGAAEHVPTFTVGNSQQRFADCSWTVVFPLIY